MLCSGQVSSKFWSFYSNFESLFASLEINGFYKCGTHSSEVFAYRMTKLSSWFRHLLYEEMTPKIQHINVFNSFFTQCFCRWTNIAKDKDYAMNFKKFRIFLKKWEAVRFFLVTFMGTCVNDPI